MYDVVEELDFLNLLSMAQTNTFFSDLCTNSFKKRFLDREIIIQNDAKSVSDGVPLIKPSKTKYPLYDYEN